MKTIRNSINVVLNTLAGKLVDMSSLANNRVLTYNSSTDEYYHADVNSLVSTAVTYEALLANGDIGTGANQVAQGDHLHDGRYPQMAGSATISGLWNFTTAPTIGGSTIWTTATFNPANYLPLSGGTMTGTITSSNQFPLRFSYGGITNHYIASDTGGVFIATFGSTNSGQSVYLETYDTDAKHRKNGVDYSILDSGNYNTYSPTLAGVGATGTWGISITGNANTATALANARTFSIDSFGTYSTNPSFNGSANVTLPAVKAFSSITSQTMNTTIGQLGNSMGMAYVSDAPSGSASWLRFLQISFDDQNTNVWQTQVVEDGSNMHFRNRQGGTMSTGSGWSAWKTLLDSGNYTSWVPKKDGTGASGTWGINITGSATSVVNTVSGTNSVELVRGNMADNDFFRILVGGTGSNAGWAEIATADDANEPIYVRQYTGVFTNLIRTATLLDASGNTSFPGTVTINALALSSTGLVTNLNADFLDGYNSNVNDSTWTIPVRDSTGTLYSSYFYLTSGDNNTSASSYTFIADSGYIRRKTLANVKAEIVTSAAVIAGLGYTPYNPATGSYLPLAGGTMTGDITVTRIRGVNSLVLSSYTTINPSSNVYLYSQPNDRDAWIFLDSADTSSNWGIYHRQIDSGVSGLPGNSIGFIGGGNSSLKSYISLADGSAYFAGTIYQGANTVLHSGNYSSYALPLSGGTLTGNVTMSSGKWLSFTDQAGTFPTAQGGFRWTLNNDGASIYAFQPYSDGIDFVFALNDNPERGSDRYVYKITSWQGSSYDKYPLIMSGVGADFGVPLSVSGNTVLHAGNYNSYAPTLTGGNASGTWGINVTGNASTATIFSTTRSNYKGVTDGTVAGQLMWKNYGNNHTIFDASAGTSPDGTSVSRVTPQYPVDNANGANTWGESPVLMGWNGNNTYGVKVDYANKASLWYSSSHPANYWLVNNWDGTYWYITSNHSSPVRVGYSDNSDTLDGRHWDAFAAGVPSIQSMSFDTIKQPGLYHYDNGISGTSPNGQANYRSIEIGNSGRYTQVAFPWNSDEMYFRKQQDSTWGNWNRIAHSGNLATLNGTSLIGTGNIVIDSGTPVVTVTQNGHGFSVGNVIRVSGANTFAKAQADSAANAEAIGYVITIVDTNTFKYVPSGYVIVGVPAVAAGTVLYLDPSTAGALTATEPTTNGQISKPLMVVVENGAKAVFNNFRGMVVSANDAYVPTSRTINGKALTGDITLVIDSTDFTLTDVTTNNASAAKHGLLPKLSGNQNDALRGDGTWGAVSSGSAFWTLALGTPTRTSNTTFTVSGDYTGVFAKGLIIKWTESSAVRVAMVSIPSTYSAPNTTITIIGDTMASIDASSLKYCLVGAEVFMQRFAVAGNISAAGTDIANAFVAMEPYRVMGSDLYVGTSGTTGTMAVDINKNGTTMFTTKPSLATTVSYSPTPFSVDNATSLALGDKVTLDIDTVHVTAAIDLYVQLYVFPSRYLNL